MKILFILDLYKPHIGGAEILFENIITRLAEKGHKIVILTTKFSKSLAPYEKISENIEIYRVGHNRYDFMVFSIFKGIKLAKDVDIIHTTTYNSAISASIIGKISGKKIVLTVLEIFGHLWYVIMGWKGIFFKFFESLIFKINFNKYICISNYTKNNLRVCFGINDTKLKTIYCGVDYSFWNKNNFNNEKCIKIRKTLGLDNNYVGLFYGRPGISKGLKYYINSIPNIIKYIPDFKALLIVSDSINNPISKIKILISNLGIEDKVILISSIDIKELPFYILSVDFVIIPSLAEGFGFAIAEVSALEQKLITTNIASITEVASGKINFIEPGNISDIVSRVIDFKSNNYIEIPKKEFQWEENIEKTLDIYNEILGRKV